MAQICQFVDAIDANPAILFDCHDGQRVKLRRGTQIGAAALNQAYTSTLMVDGGVVGSSAYGLRTLNLALQFTGSVDDALTAISRLNRVLDADSSLLKWQPDNAAQPVFIETLRSGPVQVDLTNAAANVWDGMVTLQAKPFALGMRATLGPFTVNNDPAAGSNGCYVNLTDVLGDVPAPAIITNTATVTNDTYIAAMRQRGTPSDMAPFLFVQAEATTPNTNTANPGGGPDAAMSGSGVNNYLRTTYAGSARIQALSYFPTLTTANAKALRGTYRLLAVVRRTDATSVITIQPRFGITAGGVSGYFGSTVTVPQTTVRQMVDLGVVTYGDATDQLGDGGATPGYYLGASFLFSLYTTRVSGAGNLDWDYFALVPADKSLLTYTVSAPVGSTDDIVLDSAGEAAYQTPNGVSPFAAAAQMVYSLDSASGGFPYLVPNQTNRLVWILKDYETGAFAGAYQHLKADTSTLTVDYWPRYLNVRPPTL